jgi:hypothetical protein
MVVTTVSGLTIEGIWETIDDPTTTAEHIQTGVNGVLANPNASMGLFTDDGNVIIPVRAVAAVRIRTRP